MNSLFTIFRSNGVSFGRRFRLATVSLLALVAVATVATSPAVAKSRKGTQCCCSAPEMWVINTRHLPRCSNLDRAYECMTYHRYDACTGCFVKESRASFLAQEASMPTFFYVHGNTLKHKGAMKGFWDVYEHLRCCPGKKRLVCWSWPAQRVIKMKGLRFREMVRKNLLLKYVYSEYQGYYMAKLVQQMSLSQRVTLGGHSYGGITNSVALHLLAGGCVRNMRLAGGEPVERHNLRAALISGAFDHDMLYPGHRYGLAFVAAEKIFTTFNCHDRTLKKWPKTSWRGCQALGYVGMSGRRLGANQHKLCQLNTYPENKTSHYLGPHLENPRFLRTLCCIAYGGTSAGTPTVAAKNNIGTELDKLVAAVGVEKEVVNKPVTPAKTASKIAVAKSAQKKSSATKQAARSGNRTSHLRSRNGLRGARG